MPRPGDPEWADRSSVRRTPPCIAGLLAAVLMLAACSAAQPATDPTTPTVPAPSSAAAARTSTPPSRTSSVSSTGVTSAAPTTSEPVAQTAETASQPSDEPTAEPPSSPDAGYQSTVSEIDAATAARMGSSWRPGCPVPLSGLRYLTVSYRGFDGATRTGELVVAESVAADVTDIFRQLYDAKYPIAALRLVDDFGGNDDDSMAADNSSAFNCRPVTGGGGFSEHSYGTAIDLNPVENPYLNGSLVLPPAGRGFVDRHPAPGVIQPDDAVVAAFAGHGWTWGGSWSGPIDYQHFSVSGR